MESIFEGGITPSKFAKFVTPSVIMMIVIALYSLIDAIFVSNYVGEEALAAMNIVYPISGFGWGISVMLAAGSSAIVAINMGAGKKREANEKFTLISVGSVALGIVLAVICIFFIEPIVRFLGATDLIYVYCRDYAFIILLALPAAFFGVLMEYYIRLDGRPGFTLFLYIIGGVVHLALDVVFIVWLEWGIIGAGWATAIGQAVVAIIGLIYFITQKTNLKFVRFRMNWRYIGHTLANGSSEMVSESSVAITTFIYNMIVLAIAGEMGIAALLIVQDSHYLLISAHLGFITGVAPIISFYYGAQDFEKVNVALRYCRTFILVSSVVLSAAALIFAGFIAGVFVDSGSVVFSLAVEGIRIASVAFLFTGINVFASGFFTAYGNGKISALISLSRGLIMVLVGVLILPRLFGMNGVWMVTVFAEIATLGLSIFMFKKYKKTYGYSLRRKTQEAK